MKAMILNSGIGKRLRPFTNENPKCFAKLNEKTILEHELENLLHFNIKNIILKSLFPLNIPTNPKRKGMDAIYIFISERLIVLNDGIVKLNKLKIFPVYNFAAKGKNPNERKSPHWPKLVKEILKYLYLK